jgi:endonuclease/exonuclease/phosphatase family metal-dependent hydrolase
MRRATCYNVPDVSFAREPTLMSRILNWNTEIATPLYRKKAFAIIRRIVAEAQTDVVCLTEAHPATMPAEGETIVSESAGWSQGEVYGAHKVVLWSLAGWQGVDTVGSPRLPEGRFAQGQTILAGQMVRVIGVCIPYKNYRTRRDEWGDAKLPVWEGALRYLSVLRDEILPVTVLPTIILGDFNLQIPPSTYPYASEAINHLREEVFAEWTMPTAGEHSALDKRFIDHVALSQGWHVQAMHFIARHQDGMTVSDHNGVWLDVHQRRML